MDEETKGRGANLLPLGCSASMWQSQVLNITVSLLKSLLSNPSK